MSDFFSSLPRDEEAAVVARSTLRTAPASRAEAVLRRHEAELLSVDGVEGVGVRDGHLVIYLRDEAVRSQVPTEVDGVGVETEIVGRILAL